ncbi:MAG: hypothetical protein GYB30_03100 [Gammaproteobacteria bacterium]|jgi:hypothetical protein|nr:hypothetical protein [Gammaproteobacteria bacterium]
MNKYEFSLRFDVAPCALSMDEIDDRLFEKGCDDALVRHSRRQEILLDFNRESSSAVEAFRVAYEQIKTALPQARLLEAKPDYVGPTDIACVFDLSRQRIQKILQTRASGLRALTSVGNTQVFRLSHVIDEFSKLGTLHVKEPVRETAIAAMQMNRMNDLD